VLADSDLSSRSVVLMSLGESHHGLGRFHEAIDYYTQALAIHQTTADCFYPDLGHGWLFPRLVGP
jgi:hypothetical protein